MSEMDTQILKTLEGNPQGTTELYRVMGIQTFHEQKALSSKLTAMRKAWQILLCKRAGRFGGQTTNLWHLPGQEPKRTNYKAST